jgi:hypothetical protein
MAFLAYFSSLHKENMLMRSPSCLCVPFSTSSVMKFDTILMPLEASPASSFLISYISNNNMADAQPCEAGARIALLNVGS